MIRWLYRDMSPGNRELVIKFLLCSVLGLTYALLVGDPYSATAAVTANLFLYTDRGYYGGIKYGFRRIAVQMVQGALVLAIVFPMRHWFYVPIPDTVLIILASCVAILIGLPLHVKYQIAPYSTTLANATFIMATSTVHNLAFYPFRIMHCIVGLAIGYLVNYILMPRHNRYQEAVQKIEKCTNFMLWQISPADEMDADGALPYGEVRALAETDVKFLIQDVKRGRRQRLWTAELAELVSLANQLLTLLDGIKSDLLSGEAHVGEAFLQSWRAGFAESTAAHKAVIGAIRTAGDGCISQLKECGITGESADEIVLLAGLIQYRRMLNHFIGAYNSEAQSHAHNETQKSGTMPDDGPGDRVKGGR